MTRDFSSRRRRASQPSGYDPSRDHWLIVATVGLLVCTVLLLVCLSRHIG